MRCLLVGSMLSPTEKRLLLANICHHSLLCVVREYVTRYVYAVGMPATVVAAAANWPRSTCARAFVISAAFFTATDAASVPVNSAIALSARAMTVWNTSAFVSGFVYCGTPSIVSPRGMPLQNA